MLTLAHITHLDLAALCGVFLAGLAAGLLLAHTLWKRRVQRTSA